MERKEDLGQKSCFLEEGAWVLPGKVWADHRMGETEEPNNFHRQIRPDDTLWNWSPGECLEHNSFVFLSSYHACLALCKEVVVGLTLKSTCLWRIKGAAQYLETSSPFHKYVHQFGNTLLSLSSHSLKNPSPICTFKLLTLRILHGKYKVF